MQNPELVSLLLGNKTQSQIQGLLGRYADPAVQGAIQNRQ
jgi:hypothetical protein